MSTNKGLPFVRTGLQDPRATRSPVRNRFHAQQPILLPQVSRFSRRHFPYHAGAYRARLLSRCRHSSHRPPSVAAPSPALLTFVCTSPSPWTSSLSLLFALFGEMSGTPRRQAIQTAGRSLEEYSISPSPPSPSFVPLHSSPCLPFSVFPTLALQSQTQRRACPDLRRIHAS